MLQLWSGNATGGRHEVQVGGYSGATGMFLGGWEELMEKTQTFTLYKCPQCGKVDFYEPAVSSPQGQKVKVDRGGIEPPTLGPEGFSRVRGGRSYR